MRKVGKIYRFNVSGRMLVIFFVFMLAFTALSVLVMNRYAQLYFENQALMEQLAEANRTLKELQFGAQVLAQYKELAKVMDETEAKETKESEAEAEPPPEEVKPTGPSIEVVEEPAEPEETGPKPPDNPPVDAVKLSLQPENGGTSVRFQYSLTNIHPENKAVTGYLFIVLVNEKVDPQGLAAYPEVKLEKGNPTDYKKGTAFSIRHGKTVRGRVDNLSDASNYDKGWVFAYSEEGELLLKKLLPSENGQ
jgi:hypothetical protein